MEYGRILPDSCERFEGRRESSVVSEKTGAHVQLRRKEQSG